jgi:hypothetical protein
VLIISHRGHYSRPIISTAGICQEASAARMAARSPGEPVSSTTKTATSPYHPKKERLPLREEEAF